VKEAIRPKFLASEGILVISLEPFVAGGGCAVTERNLDDISAILDVSWHDHHSMGVSWASGAGKFLCALRRPCWVRGRMRTIRSVEEHPIDSKMTPFPLLRYHH
jgi:hypothetical protein